MRSFLFALVGSLTLFAGPLNAAVEWRTFPDDPSQVSLWQDGVQLGNLQIADQKFFKRVAPGVWSEPTTSPIPVPDIYRNVSKPKADEDECPCCGEECRCFTGVSCGKDGCRCLLNNGVLAGGVLEKNGTTNYGVDSAEIGTGKHLLNGKEVSRTQLLSAIQAATVPDDSNLLFLTVIGPKASCDPVVADLSSSPLLAKFKGQYRLQQYAPDHWAVKDVGFFTGGSPTIYCQAPDGKVLHRQDDYQGPEDLAVALEKVTTLRDKDNAYDSSKDPDLRKKILDWLQQLPLQVWVIGGIVVLFLLLRNSSSK